jgi:hypothetical protein
LKIDHPSTNSLGNACTHGERCNEVKPRGPQDSLPRRQDFRSNDSRNRIRRIMESVDEIENERNEDDETDQDQRGIHAEIKCS